MLLLHHRLHDIAKSDLKAANVLTNNSLYPQAVYFYAQAFEKTTKSVVALYLFKFKKFPESKVSGSKPEEWSESKVSEKLRDIYGHKLMKITVAIAKILTERDRTLYLSRGGKKSDPLIRMLDESIKKIGDHAKDKAYLILYYESDVKMIYERLYMRLKKNTPVQIGEHYGWEILRKSHANPKTRYNKFSTLTQYLFLLLDGMDLYTRYPMEDANYNNIKFLSRPEIHDACLPLGEMVGELVSLIPLVWSKIESLKCS
jgi:hypothetical protein